MMFTSVAKAFVLSQTAARKAQPHVTRAHRHLWMCTARPRQLAFSNLKPLMDQQKSAVYMPGLVRRPWYPISPLQKRKHNSRRPVSCCDPRQHMSGTGHRLPLCLRMRMRDFAITMLP